MARTWSTFNAPPQWGKMTGIPSDFSDGKIDWGEIQNIPNSFSRNSYVASGDNNAVYFSNPNTNKLVVGSPPYGSSHEFMRVYFTHNTYWDNAENRWIRQNSDGNTNLTMISLHPDQGCLLATNDIYDQWPDNYTAAQMLATKTLIWNSSEVKILKKLILTNLPNSAIGLQSGTFWRDSNGFVRAV